MPPAPTDAAPEWGVAIQTFADHVVLRPPNRLKERATRQAGLRDKSEIEAVLRAEHALELLSTEFDGWMTAEIATLEEARSELGRARDASSLAALYRAAHDLRGQAATFGFPLAGEIADGLCTLLERLGERLAPQELIDRHVEAIRAIVRENVRNRENPLGVALTSSLAAIREKIAPRLDGE